MMIFRNSRAVISFYLALAISVVCLGADERAARDYLVGRAEGVEMAALQAATDSTFYVATIDAVASLRSLTVAHGVTPGPIRTGGATISNNPAAANYKITAAVSSQISILPILVSEVAAQRFSTGGDGTEDIDLEKLKIEDLGPCGRVRGTGTTKLGVGLYKHRDGRGYSGDAGTTLEIAHKEVDFYEVSGPYDCAKLPFRIQIPVDAEAPDDAQMQAIMIWFPYGFPVTEQKEDLQYADLPEGSVVIAAAMNLQAVKQDEDGADGEKASGDAK